MCDPNPVDGRDLPIGRLVPRTTRKTSKHDRQQLEASLRAVGLIEPLVVLQQGEYYEIIDGNLRYEVLQEMGVATVPCITYQTPPTNLEPNHD